MTKKQNRMALNTADARRLPGRDCARSSRPNQRHRDRECQRQPRHDDRTEDVEVAAQQVAEVGCRRSNHDDRSPVPRLVSGVVEAFGHDDEEQSRAEIGQSPCMPEPEDVGERISRIGAKDAGKAKGSPEAWPETWQMTVVHAASAKPISAEAARACYVPLERRCQSRPSQGRDRFKLASQIARWTSILEKAGIEAD